MKVAIHNGDGWNKSVVDFCKRNNIDYKLVDGYSNDIIKELSNFDALFWHFHHAIPKDILMARNVLYVAEQMQLKVFPDFKTSWHFDDKISQKYLLESINAPIVDSWAFYELDQALLWLKERAEYPLVAKLRRGAGSYNVRLIRNYSQAKKYAKKMFGNGVLPTPGYLADTKNKLKVAGNIKGIIKRLKKAPRFFSFIRLGRRLFPKEKGYVYFQKFIKGNTHDLRISVVGGRAWAFRRSVRKNDFRASGSGLIDYSRENIPLSIVKESIKIAKELQTQSIAFDFVTDESGNYYIVEISYGYQSNAINSCGGYWDIDLNFHEGDWMPEYFILNDLLEI